MQKQNAPKDTDPWHVLQDTGSTNTCQASGNPLVNPERNNDSGSDQTASTYLIKTKTVNDPLRPSGAAAAVFSRGDFVPLDWKDDLPSSWTNTSVQASHRLNNRDFILRRLAPNYDPSVAGLVPDFRTAPYFQDHPTAVRPTNAYSGIKPLTAYADVPPIIASGSTPLGNTIAGFTTCCTGAGVRPESMKASPPASRATPKTIMRADFIRSLPNKTNESDHWSRRIPAAKGQLMVNEK